MDLANVIATVRRPCWTAIIGIDGTGLMNNVWMKPGCGALVRMAPFGVTTLLPSKGVNFDCVARALGQDTSLWNCTTKACSRLGAVARALGPAVAAAAEAGLPTNRTGPELTWMQRFQFVTSQDVIVDVPAIVDIV